MNGGRLEIYKKIQLFPLFLKISTFFLPFFPTETVDIGFFCRYNRGEKCMR